MGKRRVDEVPPRLPVEPILKWVPSFSFTPCNSVCFSCFELCPNRMKVLARGEPLCPAQCWALFIQFCLLVGMLIHVAIVYLFPPRTHWQSHCSVYPKSTLPSHQPPLLGKLGRTAAEPTVEQTFVPSRTSAEPTVGQTSSPAELRPSPLLGKLLSPAELRPKPQRGKLSPQHNFRPQLAQLRASKKREKTREFGSEAGVKRL